VGFDGAADGFFQCAESLWRGNPGRLAKRMVRDDWRSAGAGRFRAGRGAGGEGGNERGAVARGHQVHQRLQGCGLHGTLQNAALGALAARGEVGLPQAARAWLARQWPSARTSISSARDSSLTVLARASG